jgi:uncharacterized pyridoxal phosphate-containing UPF0001 family protein
VAALAAEPPRSADGSPLAVRWHFVGHLQRNKVGGVVAACDAVHSVDSLRLLDALADAARARVQPLEVYLQVKLWPEADKGGLAPHEVEPALDALARAPGLAAAGLMTMAPLLEGEAALRAAREVFEGLATLARGLAGRPFVHGRPWLSMGMSDDLEPAVSAGSDWLRIGRALFHGLPQVGQH